MPPNESSVTGAAWRDHRSVPVAPGPQALRRRPSVTSNEREAHERYASSAIAANSDPVTSTSVKREASSTRPAQMSRWTSSPPEVRLARPPKRERSSNCVTSSVMSSAAST